MTPRRKAAASSSELIEHVRRGLTRYEAQEISAGVFARGLRTIADKLERLDGQLSVRTEDVREVFVCWCKETGRDSTRTKLTPERDRRIRGRLRDGYSLADIKLAIANVARSGFHSGENDNGKVYNDLTLICRSGSQLEQYRDMGPLTHKDLLPGARPPVGQTALPLAAEPARSYKGPDW
jgi:hypothetical protein